MLEFAPVMPVNQAQHLSNYYFFPEGFSNVEIRNILRISKLYEYQNATIGLSQENLEKADNAEKIKEMTEEVRKSKIKWMPPEEDKTEWIYERIVQFVQEANIRLFFLDIPYWRDSIQYTEYHEDVEGKYDWHIDVGEYPHNTRKLSIVVQLSDENDYEGGELEIWTGGKDIMKIPKKKGSVVVFPSFLLHRVTPVTKGVRKSLVLWVGGTTFR